MSSIKITLTPVRETHYNSDNMYGVYKFISSDLDTSYEQTLTGNFTRLHENQFYEAELEVTNHKEYGKQFKVLSIRHKLDRDNIDEIEGFLKAIISEKKAEVLLNAYPNILDLIEKDMNFTPDFKKTKGIKEKTWQNIKDKIVETIIISEEISKLSKYGVTFNKIKKMSEYYGGYDKLKLALDNNPYELTKIDGLGFKTVDVIVLKIKPELRISKYRLESFLYYYFKEFLSSDGHLFVTIDDLKKQTKENVKECVNFLDEVLRDNDFLYVDFNKNIVCFKVYYNIEKYNFNKLIELNNYEKKWTYSENDIAEEENKSNFQLTEEQRKSVINALEENVVVISGKAGTGKTSTTKIILDVLRKNGYVIGCCALSARASKIITEKTGHEATTIHRLLGSKGGDDFTFNETNFLPYDVILVDESSMINIFIFNSILKAIRNGTKLILVGDSMQLPPIGFGNVFSDLLENQHFCINVLTKVLRQAEKSGILMDANKIRENKIPIKIQKNVNEKFNCISGELEDMVYYFNSDREKRVDVAVSQFLKKCPNRTREEINNVVIVIPMKKETKTNAITTTRLNKRIQDELISDKVPKITIGREDVRIYKLGAKIMQNKNVKFDRNQQNIECGEEILPNGTIGYIEKIFKDYDNTEKAIIHFNDVDGEIIELEYTKSQISEYIELAYAITVHKMQGDSANFIIGIIDNNHYSLLDSCLLYTLLTRAKLKCLLIAELGAFLNACKTNKNIVRQTFLKDFKSETGKIYRNYSDKKFQKDKIIRDLESYGNYVTSISRCNSVKNCEYESYLTYVLKKSNEDNIYGILGGSIHNTLEDIMNNESVESDLIENLEKDIKYAESSNVFFPTENIKSNWYKNIYHFCQEFKKMEGKFETEKLFTLKLKDGLYISGYIDLIKYNDDGTIDIYDWKSSSMFKDEALTKASRQLIIYSKALMEEGYKINKLAWIMIKYVNIEIDGKIFEIERRNVAEFLEKKITNDISHLEKSEQEKLINRMFETNSIQHFDKQIQSKYKISMCYKDCEIDEDLINESIEYTIEQTEVLQSLKNIDQDNDFKHINNPSKDFYCLNLCGQRKNCKYLRIRK